MCIYKNHPSCKIWSQVTVNVHTHDTAVHFQSFLLLTYFNLNCLYPRFQDKAPFETV